MWGLRPGSGSHSNRRKPLCCFPVPLQARGAQLVRAVAQHGTGGVACWSVPAPGQERDLPAADLCCSYLEAAQGQEESYRITDSRFLSWSWTQIQKREPNDCGEQLPLP